MKLLTRIFVDLPSHWAKRRAESLWARQVGEDLYELEDVPFFAYGLNCGDVVRAIARESDRRPVVREVVRRGGHTTFRIVFRSCEDDRTHRTTLLAELCAMKVSLAAWSDGFFALDVPSEGNADAVRDRLEGLEERDVLGFETCESRAAGRFDG